MATNFLIGRGELLTHQVPPPRRKPSERSVYTLNEARQSLVPQFTQAMEVFDRTPAAALPKDIAVGKVLINPSFIARSYFPSSLLKEAGLEAVGSRTVHVTPKRWARQGMPEKVPTTELFVAGRRKSFRSLPELARSLGDDEQAALDLTHIEAFSATDPEEKVKAVVRGHKDAVYEVGVHLLSDDVDSEEVQSAFAKFAEQAGVELMDKLGFIVGNLWFLPVRGSRDGIHQLSEFSLVRVIRPMPALRSMRPMPAPSGSVKITCSLPTAQPLSSQPRVAILDGGLPDHHPIGPWMRNYELMDPDANDHADGPEHGLAVTSAFLFGPIEPNGSAGRPYSYVDHLRVVDEGINQEHPAQLYRTLGLIDEVLLSRQYEFINLSLGPDEIVDDGDPHGWTSLIDERLSNGRTFVTVAVGNNGNEDAELQLNRVQVPGDCVNVVAVGATDSTKEDWERAPYSAVGPGRSPGFVKPDLMAFGGSAGEYFHALTPGRRPSLSPQLGTSFAAPNLLRSAVGIRAILGNDLSVLAIKALLVHSATQNDLPQAEVGWGCVADKLASVITCGDGVARVVYQGELRPGKYLRAPLPVPKEGLTGKVKVKATFCYSTPTDPHHSGAYTRSGLEVVFRPNDGRRKDGKANAEPRSFLNLQKFASEQERRSDSGKWETVLHAEQSMLGKSLRDPVFDIHYIARQDAGPTSRARPIAYALVVTLEAPKHADLFSTILAEYTSLVSIQPEIALPITV
ncbi:S8 family peptidase (plasmid) [Agrobacterium tumefaciens]|uniref:S8 family peptidase n=1 Tax=Agrobacterium tumefaciens TaxID=358 RepID=UPI001571A71C|nr:S8 family peptidase [Agrobacterium tumefaciens]NSZ87082.1 S8 family peptidase [Agrobacterium tumefaciens]WCA72623.1 S8 family peptidase [Agrobacterium tumefaciens]